MNTFTKIGSDWCARTQDPHAEPGCSIVLSTRSGASKQVILGHFIHDDGYGRIFKIAPAPAAPARATEAVGDLGGILAIFATARRHLKYPAIVLDGCRISVAGDRAKEPGTLTVTGIEKTQQGRFGMEREWYGRVSLDGTFKPSRSAPADLADKLRRFAANPAGEAAAYGHLHGACCFCTRPLSDERSTTVGYGPICADHYGLPWGERAAPVLECEAA